MGRNAQPIDILVAKGKKHLTKAEIERRKSVQIKTGHKTFKASDRVMANQLALEKFKHLKKLYKEIDFVDGLDENLINRYCITYAQFQDLLDYRDDNKLKLDFDGMLKLDSRIDKKQDLLIKMEDRLFLNPVSRLKNVPKKEPKKEDPNADLFD